MSRFRPGTLTGGDAAALNDLAARVDALSRMSVAAPLSMTKSAGIPLITMTPFETILAEITEDDGGDPPVYKAKRKTREGLDPALLNAVVDYRPETVFEQVLNPFAGELVPSYQGAWAEGTLVQLVPITDWRGWWWGFLPGTDMFPAELTSGYGGATGYAWKRLVLDLTVPGYVPVSPAVTGSYAFEVGGRLTLRAGTRVLMWAAPGGGYQFQAGGGGAGDYGCGLTYDADAETVSVDLCGIAGDKSVTSLVYVESPGDEEAACSGSGSGSGSGLCAGLGVDLEVFAIEEQPLVEDTWIELTTDGKLRQTNSVVICYTVFNEAGLQIDTYFGDPVEEYTEVDLCNIDACCAATALDVTVEETSGGSGSGFGCDYSWTATPSGGVAPYTYLWDAGDGTTGTEATFTHNFGVGTWAVTLVVYDSCGQRFDTWTQTVVCEDGGGCGVPEGCDELTVASHTIGAVTFPEDVLTRECWTDGETAIWWWVGTYHTITRCGSNSLCMQLPKLANPTATPTGCAWNSPDGSFESLTQGQCIDFTPTATGGLRCGTVNVCCGETTPIVTDCCPDDPVPATLTMTLSAGTGGHAVLDGTSITLNYAADMGTLSSCSAGAGQAGWYGEFAYGGDTYWVYVQCVASVWSVTCGGCGPVSVCVGSDTADSAACNPFALSGNNLAWSSCFGGTGSISWAVS